MLSTHSSMATENQVRERASLDSATIDYCPTRDDVVISLTTVPTRIDTLKAVLHGLMMQTVPGIPIEIHTAPTVRSSGRSWAALPRWLTELRAVRVIQHARDVGPAMKYLPALACHRDRAVVVVDDDVLYPEDLVDRLLKADARWHGTSAVCLRGWRIHRELSWEKSVLADPKFDEDVQVGIICGHGGYCIRSHQVNLDELSNMDDAPEDCWMMDDVWISAHLSRAGTPKRLIEGTVRYKIPIEPALGGDRERRNDNALKWFERDWTEGDLEGKVKPRE